MDDERDPKAPGRSWSWLLFVVAPVMPLVQGVTGIVTRHFDLHAYGSVDGPVAVEIGVILVVIGIGMTACLVGIWRLAK